MGSLPVNEHQLDKLLRWAEAQALPDFKIGHARDGLFVAERYIRGVQDSEDADKLFLMALDVTFWFWMDDRCDEHLSHESAVYWEELLSSLKNDRLWTRPTPEARFLDWLGSQMSARALSKIDYNWWGESLSYSLLGFRKEETIGRGAPLPTLIEYLENGAWSMPMSNIIATASILYDMKVAERRKDPFFVNLERYLCTFTRLENDLHGFEKERKEGSPTNSVLLMEQWMPTHQAKDFVLEQKKGFGTLLQKSLESLDPSDRFVQFARATLSAHEEWYGDLPDRYEPARQAALNQK